jgi:hypothetical protein
MINLRVKIIEMIMTRLCVKVTKAIKFDHDKISG